MTITPPNRVTRTYTQRLVAEPSAVFQQLCPVREADWIADWDPVAVYSNSGVAEPDCVFVTPAAPGDAVWYITRHEPQNTLAEMLKIVPTVTATKISIRLRPAVTGSEAEITYMHTSLGPAGDAFIEAFTEEHYRAFMETWERRLNHYLTHGVALPAG
jgi:hypothetical protein